MTKQSLYTVALSVVLSVAASTAVNLAFDRQREPVLPDVVRAKGVELIDAQGRIRGTFELAKDGVPDLVMRDADGRDSIYMGLDPRGDGGLAFANDYWNEGAVILGHLQNVDDGNTVPEQRRRGQVRSLGSSGKEQREQVHGRRVHEFWKAYCSSRR